METLLPVGRQHGVLDDRVPAPTQPALAPFPERLLEPPRQPLHCWYWYYLNLGFSLCNLVRDCGLHG